MKKKNICSKCGRDITSLDERVMLKKTNKHFNKMAKKYCKEHEAQYRNHKCKPIWCEECNFLEIYQIIIDKENSNEEI
ncbi:hypothetical protein CL621_01065 [archaeon]|nr:hypothetical protein [archaeon]